AYQQQLARERDRLQALLSINNILLSTRDITALFNGIVSALKPVLQHDYTSLALLDPATGLLKIHALDMPATLALPKTEFTIPVENSPSGQCFTSGQVLIARGEQLDRYNVDVIRMLRQEGVKSCAVSLWRPTAARSVRSISPAAIRRRSPRRMSSSSNKLPRRWPSPWKMRWPSRKLTRSRISSPSKSFTWKKKFAPNLISRRSSAIARLCAVP